MESVHEHDFAASNNWWKHKFKFLHNNEVKIIRDFKIQTDQQLAHYIPHIMVVEHCAKEVWFINVAIQDDSHTEQKEQARQLSRLQN